MREEVYYFGDRQSLSGILCEAAGGGHPDLPAVIILNSGLIHRIGPNRLSVKMARMLARRGFTVFRFDFSGIGDSGVRDDHLPFARSSVLETREAMDFLTRRTGPNGGPMQSARRFILTGICSGADAAFETAKSDPRVSGILPIDFYSISSPGYQWHLYRRRLLRLRSWRKLLSGQSELWQKIRELTARSGDRAQRLLSNATDQTSLLSPERIVADMQTLAGRAVRICLIYSAESAAYYNYRHYLQKGLRPLQTAGALQVHHLEQSDHGFTLLRNQQLLLAHISRWMETYCAFCDA